MVVVSSLGPPEEGVRHVQPATSAYINQKPLGKGTLHISEARVSWVGDAGHVFSLEYPHIAMHAVSKDLSVFPNAECLYLMIDVRLVDETPTPSSTPESSDADDDDDDDEDDDGITEVRFVPDDKSQLDQMFTAMSHCQSLHPDEVNEDGEDDIEEEAEDENGVDESGDVGNGHEGEEDDMFEDADESQPMDQ